MALTVAQLVARLTADTSGFYKGMAIANSSMLRTGGIITRVAAGAGLATLGMGILSLRMAGNYEKSMNILQAVSGASDSTMKRLSATAIKLGADVKLPAVSAKDAAEAMTELAKGGLTTNQILDATRGVLQLGIAANIGFADAATVVARSLKAFGLEGTQATHVADLFTNAANASTAEISDVALGVQQASAVWRQGGQSLENLTTGITMMADAGVVGSDAGTSLKTMMQRLIAPTNKAKEAMAEAGISVYDASGRVKDMRDIVGNISQSLTGMTAAQKNATLQTLFGSDAIRAANIILGKGVANWDSYAKKVDVAGAAQKQAEARTKGFNGAVQGFQSQVETLAINLGTHLLPAATRAVTAMSNFVASIDAQKIVDFVSNIVGAIGSLLDFVKNSPLIQAALGGILAGFLAFKVVAGIIGAISAAMTVLSAAMAANPFVLVAAALVALGVAFYLAYTRSEEFREKVNAVWAALNREVIPAVKTLGMAIINMWKQIWTTVGPLVTQIYNLIRTHWQSIEAVTKVVFKAIELYIRAAVLVWGTIFKGIALFVQWVGIYWRAILAVTRAVFPVIVSVIKTAIEAVKTIIASVKAVVATMVATWNTVKAATVSAWNAIKSVVSSAVRAVLAVITGIAGAIIGAVTAIVTGIIAAWRAVKAIVANTRGWFGTVLGIIRGFVGSLYSAAYAAGTAVGKGLAAGISAMTGAVVGAAQKIANAAKSALSGVKGFLFGSPSRITYGYGVLVAQGLIDGMLSKAGDVGNSAQVIAAAVKSKILENVDPVGFAMKQLVEAMHKPLKERKEAVASAAGALMDAVQARVTEKLDKLKETFDKKLAELQTHLTTAFGDIATRALAAFDAATEAWIPPSQKILNKLLNQETIAEARARIADLRNKVGEALNEIYVEAQAFHTKMLAAEAEYDHDLLTRRRDNIQKIQEAEREHAEKLLKLKNDFIADSHELEGRLQDPELSAEEREKILLELAAREEEYKSAVAVAEREKGEKVREIQREYEEKEAEALREHKKNLRTIEREHTERRKELERQAGAATAAVRAEIEAQAREKRKKQLEAQAAEELLHYQQERSEERKRFETQLNNLLAHLTNVKATHKKAQTEILTLLNDFGVNYQTAGSNLGKAFARGLRSSMDDVLAALKDITKTISDYLKTKSPTDKGPLSDLNHWWDDFAQTLTSGLDLGYIQDQVSRAVNPNIPGATPLVPALQGRAATTPPGMGVSNRPAIVITPTVHLNGPVFARDKQAVADELVNAVHTSLLRKKFSSGSLGLS